MYLQEREGRLSRRAQFPLWTPRGLSFAARMIDACERLSAVVHGRSDLLEWTFCSLSSRVSPALHLLWCICADAGWWKGDAACGPFRSVFLPQRRMFFSEWDDGQLLRVSPPFSFVTMDGPFFPVFPSASFSSSSPPPCRHAGGRGNSERLHLAEESPHFRQREAGERATVEEGTRGERGKEGGLGEKSSPGPLQGEGNPSGDRFSPSVLEKTDDSYEGLRQRETSISRSSSERQARHGSRHRRRAERKPLGSVPCGQAGESTGEGKRRFRFGSEIVPLTSPLCSGRCSSVCTLQDREYTKRKKRCVFCIRPYSFIFSVGFVKKMQDA